MSLPADTSDRPFALPPTRQVCITLDGPPKGKGRPRFSRKTMVAYTPEPTRNYEAALRYAAQVKMAGAALIDGALRVEITALFPVPASWPQKKRVQAMTGIARPTGRPDCDNLGKMVDALNGVVWNDDAQIVDMRIVKRYSDKPSLIVDVEAL